MPFAQLEATWITQAAATEADIGAVSDWDTPRVYTTVWEGKPYRYRATTADILSQLVLHEIHHRAQVMHMLRRTGIDAGELDYNALMWTPVETP